MCSFRIFSLFFFAFVHSSSGARLNLNDLLNRFVAQLTPANVSPRSDAVIVVDSRPIEISPLAEHTATLIFLHGMSEHGSRWARRIRSEFRSQLPNVKFVCPNAAVRSVNYLHRSVPAWFNIYGVNPSSPEDIEGIRAARTYVHSLIRAEINAGIPSEQIFIAGFSMGGALSLYAGLTFDQPLGGVIGLSAFLIRRNAMPWLHRVNTDTPVFIGHGKHDSVVAFPLAQITAQALRTYNEHVRLHKFQCGHEVSRVEQAKLIEFIDTRIR